MRRVFACAAAVVLATVVGITLGSGSPARADVDGHEVVNNVRTGTFTAGIRYDAIVDCPEGKVALGGGFEVPNGVTVATSRPAGDPAIEWRIDFIPSSTVTWAAVYAICADAP